MSKCTDLYEAINDDSLPFYNKLGDEIITSIAGEMMYEDLMDGKAYMNVYWTARHFYLVSTNYHFDKMCFLHLPDEKENGIRRIYKKLINGNSEISDGNCADPGSCNSRDRYRG